MNDPLRSTYSVPCRFFGSISLELFVLQYHIWLANDAHGLLVLANHIPPFLNTSLTTIIFFVLAYEVRVVTSSLGKYLEHGSYHLFEKDTTHV